VAAVGRVVMAFAIFLRVGCTARFFMVIGGTARLISRNAVVLTGGFQEHRSDHPVFARAVVVEDGVAARGRNQQEGGEDDRYFAEQQLHEKPYFLKNETKIMRNGF